MAFDETYNEPESTEVLVKSLDPEHPAQLHYAHAGDAGADLITTVDVTLKPFERALVPTGVAIALPAGYVALVHPRSGLAAKQGVTVLLVEQNANMALKIADLAYVLETGTIKMEGEATELANNIEVRKAYLGCE